MVPWDGAIIEEGLPEKNYNRESWRGLGAMEEERTTGEIIRENHRA